MEPLGLLEVQFLMVVFIGVQKELCALEALFCSSAVLGFSLGRFMDGLSFICMRR